MMRSLDKLERAIEKIPITLDMRLIAVKMAHDPNIDNKSVAESFGISEKTLANWVIWYEQEGVDGLQHEKGAGRPDALM